MSLLDRALEVATAAARKAGRIQLKYYRTGLEIGIKKETYAAIKGNGAFLNGSRIAAAQAGKIEEAAIFTDMCNELDKRKKSLSAIEKIMHAKTIRILGSGALAVCEVAAGNIDGYFNIFGSSWDFAAAALIAREAGCVAKSPDGNEWTPRNGQGILVTNKLLCKQILQAIGAD